MDNDSSRGLRELTLRIARDDTTGVDNSRQPEEKGQYNADYQVTSTSAGHENSKGWENNGANVATTIVPHVVRLR